ncbi:SET domain-containing protein [Trametopsis cervina]|nr:SET domain-containing protein [Trametopsis cervina]
MEGFVDWFQSHHGTVDNDAMKITEIPGCARGAVALRDLPAGHTLFSIPRNLTLSTRTSLLPSKIGTHAWKQHGLHVGWAGLILCIMWEEAQGTESKWDGYLAILPSKFDTPMFWTAAELEELMGTAVVDKVGKSDAEKDYYAKVVPVIQSRPDLFPAELHAKHYTLERYHVMGSRILSRSFQVSKWEGETQNDNDEEEDVDAPDANKSVDSAAMDVDETPEDGDAGGGEDSEGADDDDDESGDDPADVALVPMADMLNARYGSENAKLFYEEQDLKMITTRPIKADEQIWNTYGDPPNSDLLRRYGHVDELPLEPPLSGIGNMADNVEVPADLVVKAVAKENTSAYQDRIDWWLEEVEDDTFIVFTDCELPADLVSLARLLLQSDAEWQKTLSKSKLPKPSIDGEVLKVAIEVLQRRLAQYPTTIEEDESLLAREDLSVNKRNAIIVRLGEKRILAGTLAISQAQLEKFQTPEKSQNTTKRKRVGNGPTGEKGDKKARR